MPGSLVRCILSTGRDLRLPRGAEPPSSKVCSTFLYSSCSELASSSGLLAEGASPTPHTSELLFTFKFPFFLFFCEDRFSSSLSKLCGGFSETQSCAFGSQPWLFQVSGWEWDGCVLVLTMHWIQSDWLWPTGVRGTTDWLMPCSLWFQGKIGFQYSWCFFPCTFVKVV